VNNFQVEIKKKKELVPVRTFLSNLETQQKKKIGAELGSSPRSPFASQVAPAIA
jgi:hypothetical protein